MDLDFEKIFEWFSNFKNLNLLVGDAIRRALDEVIDGSRTGRWDVNQLEKTEKTYIGTKVEILLRNIFELPKGDKLDLNINGIEVDIKWSIRADWMIPSEAINELCLIVTANDYKSQYSIGLIRASENNLRPSRNKDGKGSLSKDGKQNIKWLIQNGTLPENILLNIPEKIIEEINCEKSGQKRVTKLFELVREKIITRNAIVTIAQQDDPLKRVRDSRKKLKAFGIEILGHQENDPARAKELGLPIPQKGDFISVDPNNRI